MKNSWYHIMALVTVAIWGTTFVSTKVLLQHGLSPTEILLYRFVLAYISIWFFCPKRLLANSLRDESLLLAAGLCGGSLYFIAENTALEFTLASNVSLIVCTTPIITAFLMHFSGNKEKLKKKLLYGSVLALTGVALVVFNGNFILKVNPMGDILTIAAALMWSFYSIILRGLDRKYSVLFITRKVFFYGIITMIPVFLLSPSQLHIQALSQPLVIANLLFLGLVASMLCYIMWNTAMKQLGVVRTTNYIYIVPLITLITSSIVINEIITYIAIIGSIFILSGVYIAEQGLNFRSLLWPLLRQRYGFRQRK
ncbi:DMT family transporter [uncultured Bacteroides sp.]|uniref:DMT family transporter n=1 Tax=uncultured Bacteroides sp. TaxID=162156 RepID=UPI002AA732D1|nr:DMT family transporter [uncultured Bacteroides sp.]